jgi:hypothetical protein
MARNDAEYEYHMRAAREAERRIAQDKAAGRQPAKDDVVKSKHHARQAAKSA